MTRLLSLDVEPGGLDRPVGFIGVVEVVDGRVEEVELHRFLRPGTRYTWADWCASERVALWQAWMRADECGTVLDPPLHGAFTAAEVAELNGHGEGFAPEHTREEPPPLCELWSTLGPRLSGATVAAYGARFDRSQLTDLLTRAGIPQPVMWWLDGMEAIRHLTPLRWGQEGVEFDLDDLAIEAFTTGGNSLEAQVLRHGLVDRETASRRWSLHNALGVGNKALAFDAAEDARLNAVIFARLIAEHGSLDEAVRVCDLHTRAHRRDQTRFHRSEGE